MIMTYNSEKVYLVILRVGASNNIRVDSMMRVESLNTGSHAAVAAFQQLSNSNDGIYFTVSSN